MQRHAVGKYAIKIDPAVPDQVRQLAADCRLKYCFTSKTEVPISVKMAQTAKNFSTKRLRGATQAGGGGGGVS